MEVVICGPNLRNQSKGQFHVHEASCADLKKMQRREPAYQPDQRMALTADSRQEIVEWLYDDHMAEEERERGTAPDWREYDDVYLFPCVDVPDMIDYAPSDDESDDEVDEDDTEEEVDEEEGDDVPDPFAENVELAKNHGESDGKATADDALTRESILGYLDENIDEETYGEMSTYDLDRVVSNYVSSFIKGFSEQCRASLKSFLETDASLYLDEEAK